jgi:hypothetical protein
MLVYTTLAFFCVGVRQSIIRLPPHTTTLGFFMGPDRTRAPRPRQPAMARTAATLPLTTAEARPLRARPPPDSSRSALSPDSDILVAAT